MYERRLRPRTRTFKVAQLFGQAWQGRCVVRNVSTAGAGLALESTRSVPDTFDLSFDGGRTLRPCRVLWRTAREIGFEFQGSSFSSALQMLTLV